MRFGQPKSSSRVICPPLRDCQEPAIGGSYSLALRGLHSARGFISARAPLPVWLYTPIATTAKEVLNNLVYSTPVAFLVLRKPDRKIQTIVTEFQFNTPKLYKVKHGKDAAQEKRQHAHCITCHTARRQTRAKSKSTRNREHVHNYMRYNHQSSLLKQTLSLLPTRQKKHR